MSEKTKAEKFATLVDAMSRKKGLKYFLILPDPDAKNTIYQGTKDLADKVMATLAKGPKNEPVIERPKIIL